MNAFVRKVTSAITGATRRKVAASGKARELPRETPVALVVDGSSAGVLMSTPIDLQDLAVGFCISEGFIEHPDDIVEFEQVAHDIGLEARIWLKRDRSAALAERRRLIAGPVGCGMCGIDSLDQAMRRIPKVDRGDLRLSAAEIAGAPDQLRQRQPLHDETRAAHAAGFLIPGQGIVAVREDVGRHNALDKLLGALLRDGIAPETGAVIMTSRLSLELVQKCAVVGCTTIVAVSSPTVEAVEAAEGAGLTAIGFARGGSFEVFSHPERVTGHAAAA